jgi:hypothetical protein
MTRELHEMAERLNAELASLRDDIRALGGEADREADRRANSIAVKRLTARPLPSAIPRRH